MTTNNAVNTQIGTLSASKILVTDSNTVISTADSSAVGTWQLIQTQTAAVSSSIDFTTGFSGYSTFKIEYRNLRPSLNNVLFNMLVSTNGGSSYISTNYKSGLLVFGHTATTFTNSNSTTSYLISGNYSTTSGEAGSGTITLYDFASINHRIRAESVLINGGNPFYEIAFGSNNNSGFNALRLAFISANISQGTFSLYGLVQ